MVRKKKRNLVNVCGPVVTARKADRDQLLEGREKPGVCIL